MTVKKMMTQDEDVRKGQEIDLSVIGIYFFLCGALRFWSKWKAAARVGPQGHFIAKRNMSWFPIGCSLFSTNAGSHVFVGMAGHAAQNGLAVVIYEWHSVFVLILLGWFFIPVYVAS